MKKYLWGVLVILIVLLLLRNQLSIATEQVQQQKTIAALQLQLFYLQQIEETVPVSWTANPQQDTNHVSIKSLGSFDYPHVWGEPIVHEYHSSFWSGKKLQVTFNPEGMENTPTIVAYYYNPAVNVNYPFDKEFSKTELLSNLVLQKAFMGSPITHAQEACPVYETLFQLHSDCQRVSDGVYYIKNEAIANTWFIDAQISSHDDPLIYTGYRGFTVHASEQHTSAIKNMVTSLLPF